MGSSDAQIKASYNYNKKNTYQLNVRLNIKTDEDVIDHIEKVKAQNTPVRAYLIDLIRKDMKSAK